MSTTPIADPVPAKAAPNSAHLRLWQNITIALLTVGYAGYYLCRSDLSVATPLLLKAFGPHGLDKGVLGGIISLGLLAYAIGKFVNGSIADYLGGKRMFLIGMGGAIMATLVFSLGGIPIFTIAWIANRLIQSTGWVGMVKLTGKWFAYSRYGTVMGVISLSFLFGDFLSRVFLGQLISNGLGWQGVFWVSAAVLGGIFLVTLFLLKESPTNIGEKEPEAHPENLFGDEGHTDTQGSFSELLMPLLRSTTFWVVCALSFGFTLARETFNNWTPQYLTEVAGMSAGSAGTASSLFPLFGGISVVVCGWASDRLGRAGRSILIFAGLVFSIPTLAALGFLPAHSASFIAVALVAIIGFVLLGPYSFLAGAVSLDFGGKKGSATAAGWIDGIGYIGSILSGYGVGELADRYGWSKAFLVLTGMTVITTIAAAIYWWRQSRPVTQSA